jgi:hypothetical protein
MHVNLIYTVLVVEFSSLRTFNAGSVVLND